MQRRYQVVHYRTDYLLGVDRFLYQNVLVWYVRHNMDPYLVLGCLLGAPVQEYTRYFGNKRRFSLWTPQKRVTRTACLQSSAGWYPIHLGDNASVKREYCQRPGALLT